MRLTRSAFGTSSGNREGTEVGGINLQQVEWKVYRGLTDGGKNDNGT